MNSKKFLPCIYLYQKRAVCGLDDMREASIDPVALAVSYSDNKCDGIFVFDLSGTDHEHEENLDMIKEISSSVAVPVIGAGHIRRMEDVKKLLEVLQRLVDGGNTVLVIEHNLDVIKSADWIIDLGPEGGVGGGEIVAVGTPEEVARCEASYTGQYLKRVLEK